MSSSPLVLDAYLVLAGYAALRLSDLHRILDEEFLRTFCPGVTEAIDRLAESTAFGNRKLLNGTFDWSIVQSRTASASCSVFSMTTG